MYVIHLYGFAITESERLRTFSFIRIADCWIPHHLPQPHFTGPASKMIDTIHWKIYCVKNHLCGNSSKIIVVIFPPEET